MAWHVVFYFRRRLLQLNVFYQSFVTEVTKEKPAYDIHDFGCKDRSYTVFVAVVVVVVGDLLNVLLQLTSGSLIQIG